MQKAGGRYYFCKAAANVTAYGLPKCKVCHVLWTYTVNAISPSRAAKNAKNDGQPICLPTFYNPGHKLGHVELMPVPKATIIDKKLKCASNAVHFALRG